MKTRLVDSSVALVEVCGNQRKLPDDIWSPEKIADRAEKIRSICQKEVKKQLKWVPSCKKGTARWSYTAAVPVRDVYIKMFDLDANAKEVKGKKLSLDEFRRAIGNVEASVSVADPAAFVADH